MTELIESNHQKRVRFTCLVQVTEYNQIDDPALKADLYYSKAEMAIIRQRFIMTISLRRQLRATKRLQEEFNESKLRIDDLRQTWEANERKRLFQSFEHQQPSSHPGAAKRRRTL